MAANDKKRYFWLKLKEDFFKQHKIKVLKSLPNGRIYTLIYLELLAESTSHEGELRFSRMLPYSYVTLAAVIDEDPDNVKSAIEAFVQLELVEILSDETIYLREIQKLIGSETGQTIRKRKAKLKGGKFYPQITQESRDKSIEDDDKYNTRQQMMFLIRERWMEAGYSEKLILKAFSYMDDIEMTEDHFAVIISVLTNNKISNPAGYIRTIKENGDLGELLDKTQE